MSDALQRIEQGLKSNDLNAVLSAAKGLGTVEADVSRGHQLIGDLWRRRREFSQALKAYDVSLEASKNKNMASLYGKLECLKELGQHSLFQTALTKFRENARFNENLFSRLALAAAELGDKVNAQALIAEITQDGGDEPRTWFRLAKARLLLGEKKDALNYAKRARDLAGGDKDLLLEIATIDYDVSEYWELRYNSSQGERTPVPVDAQSDQSYEKRTWRDVEFLKRTFSSLFGQAPFAKVADCGCGSGRLTPFLSEWAQDLDCFDISPTAISYAEWNNDGLPHVTFRSMDLSQTMLPAAAYDLVFDYTAVQHVSDPAQWRSTLRNYIQACKPGGMIFLLEVLSDGKDLSVLHVSNATPEDYVEIMETSGATLIHKEKAPWTDVSWSEICFVFQRK